MLNKYPQKKLCFLADNLWAHKSDLVMKIIQEPRAMIFYVPSNTPEFSAIENMFSILKKQLKCIRFTTKEYVALKATEIMFSLEKSYYEGFFRRAF